MMIGTQGDGFTAPAADLTTAKSLAAGLDKDAAARRSLVSWLDQHRRSMETERARHHRAWAKYYRIFRAKHYPNDPDADNPNIVHNITFKVIAANTAMIGDSRMRGEVVALQPNAEEISRVLDSAVAVVQEKNELDRVITRVVTDGLVCGTGIVKSYWDAEWDNRHGRIRIGYLDIFNFFPDIEAKTPADLKMTCERHVYPLSVAKAKWPEWADKLKPERQSVATDSTGLYRPHEALPDNSGDDGTYVIQGPDGSPDVTEVGHRPSQGSDERVDDIVYVYEWWIKDDYSAAEFDVRAAAAAGEDPRKQAEYENSQFAEGLRPPVRLEDVHTEHIPSHSADLKAKVGLLSLEEIDARVTHLKAHQAAIREPAIVGAKPQKYPGGWRVILQCGEAILQDGESPTGSPHLPYSFFFNYTDPGEFWGQSEVQQLESLQRMLDLTMSNLAHMIQFNAFRPLFVNKTSGINVKELTNQIGYVKAVPMEAGVEVAKWGPELVISQVYLALMTGIERAMLELAGVSEIVEGTPPQANMSGLAMGITREASMTRTRERARSLEAMIRQMVRYVVALIQTYWTDPMLLKVQGERGRSANGAMEVPGDRLASYVPINWTGEDGSTINDVRSFKLDEIDVRVDATGSIPQGRAQRMAEYQAMLQTGVITMPVLRRHLVALGKLSEQDVVEMQQEEQQQAMMMAQAQQAAQGGPPGMPPPGSEPPMPPMPQVAQVA